MAYILKIKIIDDQYENIKKYYEDFKNHHEGDSGVDLILSKDQIIHGGFDHVETLDFKIQCEMVDSNNNNVSYYLYPRSSISKTPFMMANSVGIIDAGYRGNIMAKIRNFSANAQNIFKNDKLFQICAPDLKPIIVQLVDELSETSRGSGGFGSTNK
jgi:dUTP pyrophosphatase